MNSKNRVFYKEEVYYCDTKNWRFSHKLQGLFAYGKGFKKRIDNLKKIYLIDEIKFKKNDFIIDVGANNGDFFLCFDEDINYCGIEPSPEVFSNLEYNVKKQNLINKGCWKESGKKIEFYLKDEFGDSSFIPIDNFSKKIIIDTITLDDVISQVNKPIKLIKLEAEGAEPEVLFGLKNKINLVEYITIDCGFERGINQASTITQCSNYLISNNFEMINFGFPRLVALYKNKNFNKD